jgi:hypothetical protein
MADGCKTCASYLIHRDRLQVKGFKANALLSLFSVVERAVSFYGLQKLLRALVKSVDSFF